MVAMRRSLLAGLLVAVVALVGGCGDGSAAVGSQAWLVGTWGGMNPDGKEGTITFNADGSAKAVGDEGKDVDVLQYTLAGTVLTITEIRRGELREPMDFEMTNMTPMSFSLAMPGVPSSKLDMVRQPD